MFNLLHFLAVFKKELKDAVRDKRSLRIAFLPAVYFVGMFAAIVLFTVHSSNEKKVDGIYSIKVPVQGAENLPSLMDWLTENGAVIEPIEKDAFQKVKNKSLEFALVIPDKAKEQYAQAETAATWLIYDASNPKTGASVGFVRSQFSQWSQKQAAISLVARGIDPSLVTAAVLHENNIADERKMGIYILASLPMTLLLAVFVASVGFSADMTAGERERRSLESLLITPASSASIYFGKWFTSVCLTLAVLTVQLILLGIAFHYLPFNQLGLRVQINPTDLVQILALLMPIVFIAASLQLSISMFAKSFKDAQTLLGLLMILPMIPIMYTLFNPGLYSEIWLWIPVLGQTACIKQIALGETLGHFALFKFWFSGILFSGLIIFLGIRKLRTPKIIYGQ